MRSIPFAITLAASVYTLWIGVHVIKDALQPQPLVGKAVVGPHG